ncbi:MAG TPA: nucleotide exchange factor GrpE [Acidimicrobiia bacterium]|nr:nucleotide exchange factor GrpE [Acidimicrobiia bacterium]
MSDFEADGPPPDDSFGVEGEVVEGEIIDDPPAGGADAPFDAEAGADPELARLQAERDEYLVHLQRTQAEFDNYRKRMLRDQTAHLERATANLIEQLLPVLDSFELALGSGGTDVERLRKGVELVYGELLGVLEKAGLQRIEALGKPFDPEEHEAVMHVENEDGEPGVRDVVRTGYRLKGRVLRPAMVKVAT